MFRWLLACSVLLISAHVSADTPSYMSLPEGKINVPSFDEQPEDINGTEKVDGIYAALPAAAHQYGGVKGTRYVSLFSNAKAAEVHSGGNPGSGVARMLAHALARKLEKEGTLPELVPGPGCFTVVDHWQMQRFAEQGWPMSFVEQPQIHGFEKGSPAQKQYPQAGVRAVRYEKLDVQGSQATLASSSMWLDPSSLGLRLIGKSSMKLAEVADGPGSVRVFAARDKSGEAVHFVVQMQRRDSGSLMHLGRNSQLFRAGEGGHSDCGHARLSLRTAPGAGETGSIDIEVVLPVQEESRPQDDSDSTTRPRKEVIIRTLSVHLGVTRTASDLHPIPTVSFGWSGRARRMDIF